VKDFTGYSPVKASTHIFSVGYLYSCSWPASSSTALHDFPPPPPLPPPLPLPAQTPLPIRLPPPHPGQAAPTFVAAPSSPRTVCLCSFATCDLDLSCALDFKRASVLPSRIVVAVSFILHPGRIQDAPLVRLFRKERGCCSGGVLRDHQRLRLRHGFVQQLKKSLVHVTLRTSDCHSFPNTWGSCFAECSDIVLIVLR